MTLYALKREYEERKQALLDKLENNPHMDAALQHQIYGAVKEIEHFMDAIDMHMRNEQQLNIDLSRDRPRPLFERTKRIAGKVRTGTRKVVKEKIPAAAKKVASKPRQYMQRRRELRKLRKAVEEELRTRIKSEFPSHIHEEMHPTHKHQDIPGGMSGTVTGVRTEIDENDIIIMPQRLDYAEDEPQQVPKTQGAKKVKKRTAKKPAKKRLAKKAMKKSPKKPVKKKKR